MAKEKTATNEGFDPTRGVPPGDSSDTPGRVVPNNDTLGCGAGQTVSGMEQMMLLRITELRTTPHGNSPGLQVNGDLVRACRDACQRAQAQQNLDQEIGDVKEFLGRFGWRGERCDMIRLWSVQGSPQNPPDPGDLIHVVARGDKELAEILTSPDWNEVGCSVFGSCYGMGAVVAVGHRQHAPGPTP